MKNLIFLFLIFLFCGCYTQVVTTDTEYVSDYIGVTITHPLWVWHPIQHYWYIDNHQNYMFQHPNRRDRVEHKYLGQRNQPRQFPPASRTRR